jgi:putative phage-type endonuclease
MTPVDDLQRTDHWFEQRLGRATASRISDILAKTKSGPSASRANYAAQLVCERLTGQREECFVSQAMVWGTEQEAAARECYAFETGSDVVEVGFVPHPTIEMSGASPDGLVGDVGLIEIKAPGTAKHIATLTGGSIDSKYMNQMQWQLACTGRAWCDFVSYDPRLPVEMQLATRRVHRDDEMIAEMEREVVAFLAEVSAMVETLTTQFRKAA